MKTVVNTRDLNEEYIQLYVSDSCQRPVQNNTAFKFLKREKRLLLKPNGRPKVSPYDSTEKNKTKSFS